MIVFVAVGVAVWLLLVLAVLSLCRAAAHADEAERRAPNDDSVAERARRTRYIRPA